MPAPTTAARTPPSTTCRAPTRSENETLSESNMRIPKPTTRDTDTRSKVGEHEIYALFANAVASRKVVPLFAKSFQRVTADWPFGSHSLPMNPEADLGPGGIAETLTDAIEALDLDGVTRVGNDGWGMLCQLVATTRPQRPAPLVLTPCDAYDNFPPEAFAPLSDLARSDQGMELIADAMADPQSRRRPETYGWLSHEPLPDQVLDHFARPLRDPAIRRDAAKFLTP
jgi:pimeloyl-ACP methyl ester carboxylesterase